MEQRICKRCLLRDMDEQEQYETVTSYLESLDEDLRTPARIYEERLGVCKQCERLLGGLCNACGCFVELRAGMKKNYCPYHKWESCDVIV